MKSPDTFAGGEQKAAGLPQSRYNALYRTAPVRKTKFSRSIQVIHTAHVPLLHGDGIFFEAIERLFETIEYGGEQMSAVDRTTGSQQKRCGLAFDIDRERVLVDVYANAENDSTRCRGCLPRSGGFQ